MPQVEAVSLQGRRGLRSVPGKDLVMRIANHMDALPGVSYELVCDIDGTAGIEQVVVLGELSRVEALRDAIDYKLWCGADHIATALLVTDKRLLEAVVEYFECLVGHGHIHQASSRYDGWTPRVLMPKSGRRAIAISCIALICSSAFTCLCFMAS